ncbi:MAG: hypothetical protein ABIQ27_01135 [Flavobacterium sp.]|uniref:hypothetical protein n=1 Tax=Flavobacterium sp. TaxID=239 RepID=UPI003264695A
MIILEEQTGLNAGLNRGFKLGKMLKKNIRLKNVSIKNAIKVGKVAIPLATTAMSFIPGGGIAGKILDSKAGKLFTKIKSSKAVKFATKIGKSKVGKFAINNVVKPTFKNAVSGGGSEQVNDSPQSEVMQNATPTPQQLETIAQVKGVPAETLTADAETNEASPNDAQLETISRVKDIPVENLKDEVATQKEMAKNESAMPTDKPNYTIPIVIGVGVVGAVLLATSSKSNQ